MESQRLHQVLAVLWLAFAAALLGAGAVHQPSSNCRRKCGDVDVPYPFGIGPDDCAATPGFILKCNDTAGGGPYVSFPPYINHVNVLDISSSLQQGQARMDNRISSACYNTTSQEMDFDYWWLNFTNMPYRFSTANRFTVIGCNTLAYIRDDENNRSYTSGCVAMCNEIDVSLTDGSCSGIGCCQTAIPKGLQYYKASFVESLDTTEIYSFSPCSYAVIMDSSAFRFQASYVTSRELHNTNSGRQPLLIDWAIGNERCAVASNKPDTYACVSKNSKCMDSPNGPGYICQCTQGYEGNPYLLDPDQGCKDVHECMDQKMYPCHGECSSRY